MSRRVLIVHDAPSTARAAEIQVDLQTTELRVALFAFDKPLELIQWTPSSSIPRSQLPSPQSQLNKSKDLTKFGDRHDQIVEFQLHQILDNLLLEHSVESLDVVWLCSDFQRFELTSLLTSSSSLDSTQTSFALVWYGFLSRCVSLSSMLVQFHVELTAGDVDLLKDWKDVFPIYQHTELPWADQLHVNSRWRGVGLVPSQWNSMLSLNSNTILRDLSIVSSDAKPNSMSCMRHAPSCSMCFISAVPLQNLQSALQLQYMSSPQSDLFLTSNNRESNEFLRRLTEQLSKLSQDISITNPHPFGMLALVSTSIKPATGGSIQTLESWCNKISEPQSITQFQCQLMLLAPVLSNEFDAMFALMPLMQPIIVDRNTKMLDLVTVNSIENQILKLMARESDSDQSQLLDHITRATQESVRFLQLSTKWQVPSNFDHWHQQIVDLLNDQPDPSVVRKDNNDSVLLQKMAQSLSKKRRVDSKKSDEVTGDIKSKKSDISDSIKSALQCGFIPDISYLTLSAAKVEDSRSDKRSVLQWIRNHFDSSRPLSSNAPVVTLKNRKQQFVYRSYHHLMPQNLSDADFRVAARWFPDELANEQQQNRLIESKSAYAPLPSDRFPYASHGIDLCYQQSADDTHQQVFMLRQKQKWQLARKYLPRLVHHSESQSEDWTVSGDTLLWSERGSFAPSISAGKTASNADYLLPMTSTLDSIVRPHLPLKVDDGDFKQPQRRAGPSNTSSGTTINQMNKKRKEAYVPASDDSLLSAPASFDRPLSPFYLTSSRVNTSPDRSTDLLDDKSRGETKPETMQQQNENLIRAELELELQRQVPRLFTSSSATPSSFTSDEWSRVLSTLQSLVWNKLSFKHATTSVPLPVADVQLLVRKTIKSDFFDLIGVERAVDLQQPSPLYSSSFSYTFPVASTSRPGGSAVLPPKGMSRTASSPAPSTALNFTEFGQQSRSQPFGAASNSPFLMSSRRTAVTGNMSQASAALAALRALPDTPVHSFGLPTASLTSNQLLRASSPMAVLQRHVFDSPATPNVRKQ